MLFMFYSVNLANSFHMLSCNYLIFSSVSPRPEINDIVLLVS